MFDFLKSWTKQARIFFYFGLFQLVLLLVLLLVGSSLIISWFNKLSTTTVNVPTFSIVEIALILLVIGGIWLFLWSLLINYVSEYNQTAGWVLVVVLIILPALPLAMK